MSLLYRCDYCGKNIASGEPRMALEVAGTHRDPDSRRGLARDSGWLGHYHGDTCYWEMFDAIELVHSFAPMLESIPTASVQWVTAQRRKMRRREEG